MNLFLLAVCLLLVGLPAANGQSSQAQEAEKSWSTFYPAFQSAVTKRDRVALKKVLASPFDSGGGGDYTPAKWMKFIEDENLWGQLRKSVATGTRPFPEYSAEHKRPSRVTKDKYLVFSLGKDGQWRWVAVMGD